MGRPSLLEVLLLAVAICVSLGLFWVRFQRFYGNFKKAKPDPDYSIHPIWPRVRDFVWEVLCQGLVIKERPLPGLAHAFVFWGFLAFGLITMNHVAEGFGFDAVSRDSWFGTAYFGFVYLFAAVVAVSIAGLFVRRFFVRPRWLGAKVSYESGFIAFLIFLLMVTYMAGFHITPRNGFGQGELVAAYDVAAGVPAAYSAYQALASGVESVRHLSRSGRGSATFPSFPVTKISGSIRAKT